MNGGMSDKVRLYDLIKESFLLLDFGDRLFLEQFSLTVPRYYALIHIAGEPGLSPSHLSQCMFCDKSNITRLIHGLESDGLVERRPHEHDGRSYRLFLTPAGKALQQEASEAHRRYVNERLRILEECRANEIADVLIHLNGHLSRELGGLSAPSLN